MQTTSLSVLVNADKRASFRILGTSASPLATGQLSHQTPLVTQSSHCLHPLTDLDLTLPQTGLLAGPGAAGQSAPQLVPSPLSYPVGSCFTSPRGQRVEAGVAIRHLISGNCGGPQEQGGI